MKKTLYLLTAVTTLCAATPAIAQYYARSTDRYPGYARFEANFDARIDRLRVWLSSRERAGTIDRREAWSLRRQLNDLTRLEQRYRYGGFNRVEIGDLEDRIAVLDRDLQIAHSGSLDRYDRYRADGYYGRGGPIDDWIGLRIGERATSGLDRVPYDHGMRYRDTSDIYYRSDGRAIYGIDPRTGLVIQVYPMN